MVLWHLIDFNFADVEQVPFATADAPTEDHVYTSPIRVKRRFYRVFILPK